MKGHSVRRGNASQLCPPTPRAPTSIQKLRAIGGSESYKHRNPTPSYGLHARVRTFGCFTQNARRREIVYTRLEASTAERESTSRRNAGNTVDR